MLMSGRDAIDDPDLERSELEAAAFALASSHGVMYGTADVSPEGIDRSQLRRNLQLSPQERVEQMVRAVRALQELQGIVRRQSH